MNRSETVDAAILDALDRGEHAEALEALMETHGIALYRFCRRIAGDDELAEEAHQLAFVQAYRSLATFSRRSSIRTWLFSIARHRCLDLLKSHRRRSRRFELVDEPPETVGADDTSAGEAMLEDRDRRGALDHCLGQLAEPVRAAVVLRYREGMSYPEMETVLDERANSLQARVARALPALRRCMESAGWAA